MRRLFGVLRTEGEQPLALAPQPGLSELDRLVRQVGSADMQVDLRIEGDPVPLSPGVDLAAYRIAQEGLTNACATPGPPAPTCWCATRPAGWTSRWRTTGAACPQPSANGTSPNGGGHGLVGIRERVALYGGTVDLVPSSSGGVRLAVSLPLKEETT